MQESTHNQVRFNTSAWVFPCRFPDHCELSKSLPISRLLKKSLKHNLCFCTLRLAFVCVCVWGGRSFCGFSQLGYPAPAPQSFIQKGNYDRFLSIFLRTLLMKKLFLGENRFNLDFNLVTIFSLQILP